MTRSTTIFFWGLLCLMFAACNSTPESKPEAQPKAVKTPKQQPKPEAENPHVSVDTVGSEPVKIVRNEPIDTAGIEQRIPGDHKGNYVWGAAATLAWKEIMDSILHGPLELKDLSKAGKAEVDLFNQSKFTKKDLDAASYFVEAGFGQQTIRYINAEVPRKFPKGGFEKLEDSLEPQQFIGFALLYKYLEYERPFEPFPVYFGNTKVKGFGGIAQYRLSLLDYQSDDRFILQLWLKNRNDHLILCKGYEMKSPTEVLAAIRKKDNGNTIELTREDRFQAPCLHFEWMRSYRNLQGRYFANAGFETKWLEGFTELVKFDMDEIGVKVVNQTALTGKDAIKAAPPKPKNLFLNNPYWIIMKRKDSPRPYFILGVRNTAMMTLAKKEN